MKISFDPPKVKIWHVRYFRMDGDTGYPETRLTEPPTAEDVTEALEERFANPARGRKGALYAEVIDPDGNVSMRAEIRFGGKAMIVSAGLVG